MAATTRKRSATPGIRKAPKRGPGRKGSAQPRENAYQKARRRRTNARRRRRLEAALPAISISIPSVSLPTLRRPTFGVLGSGWRWSKMVSATLLAGMIAAFVWIQTDILWYVYSDSVFFEDATYLQRDELYLETDLQAWNIFWVRPQTVRAAVMEHPYVADAQVRVQLPNEVHVAVDEVEPVAVWVTELSTLWILGDGRALEMRSAPDASTESRLQNDAGEALPMLIDAQRGAAVADRSRTAVDPEILTSALALLEEIPGLENVRYNEGIGLNFGLPGTDYWIYWGDGERLADKLAYLEIGQELLTTRAAFGQVIDVRFRDHPIIR